MYLNKNIGYLFSSLINSIVDYKVYIFIIISSIILLILLLNKSKIMKYIVLVINIVITILIMVNYNTHLFNINIFNHFLYNIYFYFLNSIVFMIINTIVMFKDRCYKTNSVFYIIHLIFILFSLFITYYLSNNHYLVLFNIYPEIVLGNILYFIYYFIIIITFVKSLTELFYSDIIKLQKR